VDPAVDDEVPDHVLGELRSICVGLPETYEEPAWVGRRWCVRKRTFAHVFHADLDGPPTMVRIAKALGPCTLVVFRSEGTELDMLKRAGPPFFTAGWGRDVMSLRIDERTDWAEVAELLTESYCMLAPLKLRALVDRPGPDH
jgi:hypothetical protein